MGCYLMSYNIVETKRENIFFFRIDNVINTIEAPTKDKTVVKTLQFTTTANTGVDGTRPHVIPEK